MEENILPTVIDDLQNYFSFLFERGFKIQSSIYSPESFGDWEIVLYSSECKIRFSTDRMAVGISFGPTNETTQPNIGFLAVIYFISKGQRLVEEYEGKFSDRIAQFKKYAPLLRDNLDAIINLFGSEFEKHRSELFATQMLVNDIYLERFKQKYKENLTPIKISDVQNDTMTDIQDHLKILFENGYKVNLAESYFKSYQEWEVILRSEACALIVIYAQGEIFVGLSPASQELERFISLDAVAYFLDKGEKTNTISEIPKSSNLASNDNRRKQLDCISVRLGPYLDEFPILFGDKFEQNREDLFLAEKAVHHLYLFETFIAKRKKRKK